MPLITAERLRRFAPGARADIVAALVDGADKIAAAGLTSPLRVAHFLSQIATESAGLTRLEENLNYSAARLRAVWPKRFPSNAVAAAYAHSPEKLADKIYGGRLGNAAPGDGWRYRGSGLMQTTGRDNYEACGHADDPDALRQAGPALDSALEFWADHGCNRLADADDCEALTRKVNGGLNGLADRKAHLRKAKGIFRAAPAFSGAVGFADLGAGLDADPAPITEEPTIRHVQGRLRELGYAEVGSADGTMGPRTQAAILAFRNDNGLPVSPVIDSDLIAALPAASPREISRERATSKPDDSRILKGSSQLVTGAAGAGGLGVLSDLDVSSWLDKAEGVRSYLDRFKGLLVPLNPYVTVPNVLIVAAIVVGFIAWRIGRARIEDHRSGATP